MSDSNPFKRKSKKRTGAKDFQTLFKDLPREPHIRGLHDYQMSLLKDYESNHKNTPDIGLELPTGSGKTLVGLLIGEWRRFNLSQRILYLCQTKQLANQVYNRSKEYGIDTRILVGSKHAFDKNDVNLYRQSKTIAITTYSALFNYSPEFKEPQTIIMDDVHGGENYISSLWSVIIKKEDTPYIFDTIIKLYNSDLPKNFLDTLESGRREILTHKIEKVPFSALYNKRFTLIEIMDEYINEENCDNNIKFPWLTIRNNVHACNVFISFDRILIRPYIAPTLTHDPFRNADQRIYMSATLGNSGELERITGVRSITNLYKPGIFKTRGIGKRFYIFPDYFLEGTNYINWVINKLQEKNRTLILCPRNDYVKVFDNIIKSRIPYKTILHSSDIEENLDSFTTQNNSILLLANRYDGIDITDNACDQILIVGFPSGTNLQEQFLQDRLNLDSLLKERILTRIQQASGRCTRSDSDRAAVILADSKLLNFCSKIENQKSFHPQIKGEIGLFFDVEPDSIESVDNMLSSFYNQDEYWESAEEIIQELRDEEYPLDTTVNDSLSTCVKSEVDFMYDMWAGNFQNALARGKSILSVLHGPKLSQYRALWGYFSSTPALILANESPIYLQTCKELIYNAKAAMRTNSWFPHAFRNMLPNESIEESNDLTALAVEGVLSIINDFGAGKRFYQKIDALEAQLNDTSADNFDDGLVKLGKLLGFSTFKPAGSAAPDAVWYLEDILGIIFEGKSDEDPEHGISVDNCSQTSRHKTWAKSNDIIKNVKDMYCVLVTPKEKINEDAIPFSSEIYYLNITKVLALFNEVKKMLIEIKDRIKNDTDQNDIDIILFNLNANNLTPSGVLETITVKKVSDLLN